jgi:hypothetical protein
MTFMNILKIIVWILIIFLILFYPIFVDHRDPFTFYWDKLHNLFFAIKNLIQVKGG